MVSMIPHFLEPEICKLCEIEPCNGDYLKCLQDERDKHDDVVYARKKEE